MGRSRHWFQSTQGTMAVADTLDHSPGHEGPKGRYYIVVEGTPCNGAGGPVGPEQELCLYLTVEQMVQIVVAFFREVVWENHKKNVFCTMLRRLLKKRWATMTSPIVKYEDRMRYFDLYL